MVGFFEQRAIEAQRRRQRMQPILEEDFAPIVIVSTSRGGFAQVPLDEVREALKQRTVFFLHERDELYAMVLPPDLVWLLEVRDVLNDSRQFRVVEEREEEESVPKEASP